MKKIISTFCDKISKREDEENKNLNLLKLGMAGDNTNFQTEGKGRTSQVKKG